MLGGDIALLFNLGAIWGLYSTPYPDRLPPPPKKKPPVPLSQETGCATDRIWTGRQNRCLNPEPSSLQRVATGYSGQSFWTESSWNPLWRNLEALLWLATSKLPRVSTRN